MKHPKTLVLLALGLLSPAAGLAAAPASVGDSFICITYQTKDGFLTDERSSCELVYLGADGTCERLYTKGEALGVVSYGPTLSGTYTYVPTPGNSSEAMLKLGFPDPRQYESFGLEFAFKDRGTVKDAPSIGTESFAIIPPDGDPRDSRLVGIPAPRAGKPSVIEFTVNGKAGRLVLVRAVDPGLSWFSGPASTRPKLEILSGGKPAAPRQPWEPEQGLDEKAMTWVLGLAGAAPHKGGPAETTFFGLLGQGSYSARALGSDSARVEVYILPYSG
jgi:hypothetical protein